MKCENKGCLNSAETESKFCSVHGGKPPAVVTGMSEGVVVSMSEVPRSARFNPQAAKLVKKMRGLQTGSALKLEIKYYSIPTLTCAKRYALEGKEPFRIGVRVCGEIVYVWRLSDEELKEVEKKATRLAEGRAKKKGSK